MTKIIGLSAKMGSGKDYICDNVIIPYLKKKNKSCLKLCFADQLKVNVQQKYPDLSYNDVYTEKTDYSRQLLQIEGQKYREDDANVWIKYFDIWFKIFENRGFDYIICTDVRYINEFNYIKSKGGVLLKIVSPKRNESRLLIESKGDIEIYNKIKFHSSETALDEKSDYDFVIYNDPGIFFAENAYQTIDAEWMLSLL